MNMMMDVKLLAPKEDPMGAAISDYWNTGKASRLRVFSSQFEEDEIPVETLFRTWEEMPELEQKALELAQGKILDVGAGSGCHSLALKALGKDVLAIDISALSVQVMQQRGVNARQANLFDPQFVGQFDTILMLMNGSGIIGRIANLGEFFGRMRALLSADGCILMDSSDVSYLYEDEDGGYVIDLAAGYYGEIDFWMQYKQVRGEAFDWLYIDFDTLSMYAAQYGFLAEKLQEGVNGHYLAKLTAK